MKYILNRIIYSIPVGIYLVGIIKLHDETYKYLKNEDKKFGKNLINEYPNAKNLKKYLITRNGIIPLK